MSMSLTTLEVHSLYRDGAIMPDRFFVLTIDREVSLLVTFRFKPFLHLKLVAGAMDRGFPCELGRLLKQACRMYCILIQKCWRGIPNFHLISMDSFACIFVCPIFLFRSYTYLYLFYSSSFLLRKYTKSFRIQQHFSYLLLENERLLEPLKKTKL